MITPFDLMIALGENMALVLVLLGLENQVRLRLPTKNGLIRSIIMGVMFCGIALLGMQLRIEIAPGVFVDARVVVVAMAGTYYGLPAACVAGTVVAIYRYHLGGPGALSGSYAVLGGGVAGWLINRWVSDQPERLTGKHFLVLGIGLFLWGLLTAMLLPWEMVRNSFFTRIVPVPLTYPVAVFVFGSLLGLQFRERAAQLDLKTSRERLALATRTAGLGVWDWDIATNSVVWDDRIFQIYGHVPESIPKHLIYRSWLSSLHPDDRAGTEAMLMESVGKAKDLDCRFRIIRPDGSERLIRACAIAIMDEQGGTRRMVGINEDVTERISKDVELDNYRTRLEDLVAVRTCELQRVNADVERARQEAVFALAEAKRIEESYLVAKLSAERANNAKSEFLSSMSHEIRTPLNAVLGYAQMLTRDASLAAPHRSAVEVINRSGEHLLSLINDILEMTRIEAGHVTCNPEDFNLHGLFDNIKSLFLQRVVDKGLRLSMDIPMDLPRFVRADQRKIRQILLNLLSNALKFTSAGSITISASLDGTVLRISVQDTGCGISADDLNRLYRPFMQAQAGRRMGEGSGLGLALSRGFADVMGGALLTESVPGEGSIFKLTIPVQIVQGAVRQPSRREVIGLAPGQQGPRILIAEDHVASRSLLAEILTSAGCDVHMVGDGRSAIEECRTHRFALIWMDIDMPELDGLSAAREIKALPYPPPRIIAFTAAAFEADRRRILAGGCDEIINKPYQEDEIFMTMEMQLNIHFIWKEQTIEVQKPMLTMVESEVRSRLMRVCVDDRSALVAAVTIGDMGLITTLLATWSDEGLARELGNLAHSYAFDQLQSLLGSAVEQP